MASTAVILGAFLTLALPASAQDAAAPGAVAHEWGPTTLSLADPPPGNARRGGEKPSESQEIEPRPRQDRLPDELKEWRKEEGSPFIDLGWMDMETRAGIAIFTDDYKIDPTPAVSLLMRAPMPWLSPASDPDGDYFGIYADFAVLPGVKRDLNPAPEKDSGTVFLLSMGGDFTFVRNQGFLLMFRGGGQYALYGDIEGLSDGWAGVAGLSTGLYIGSGMTFTLSSDAIFADADNQIIASYLGLMIEF